MLRILQFGETGQVASELRRLAGGELSVIVVGRQQADLARPESVTRAIDAVPEVDLAVNAAAYTAVDRAQSEPEQAHAVNATAPGVMAQACARRGTPLLHISTDYVFDGTLDRPYREGDQTSPINVYGASKLAGEEAVRAASAQHIILRTSWVYAAHGSNFVRTMLRLGSERDELRIVDDQLGCPTSAKDIAQTIVKVARQVKGNPTPEKFGTFHFSDAGETSWFGFAQEIFRQCDWARLKAQLMPIPSSEYPTPARRPANSRLDISKIQQVFGIRPRDWREALRNVTDELRESASAKP